MKKQILEALKVKFEGISEAVLSRIAEKLAKTTLKEEDVATVVGGVTITQVLESYGDSRATEAQQTAVLNYEKKHNIKDGQKAEGVEPAKPIETKTPITDDTPAWAKALIDSQKNLADKLASLEGEKVVTTRKQKLDSIINKLPENLRKPYQRTPLKDLTDEAFDALTGEISAEVESLATEITTQGALFGRPKIGEKKQSNEKQASKEEVDAIAKALNV